MLCALAAALSAQSMDDAQIAAIVVTANQVDIDAGTLAAARASHPDVKAFGQRMAADHAGVNRAASDLAGRLKLTPKDNPTARSIKEGGDKNLAKLETLTGAAFDKAYIDHEVVYHQQVLDALDKTLIPNAKNEELKALLVKVRPAFVAHLEHAKDVQAALAKKGSAQHMVTIEAMRFQPADLTVKAGDSIVWTNRDSFPHTATSQAGGFDSDEIAAGRSWTYTAATAGEFPYLCTLHRGMKGTLRVR
jgi:putative membrane protein